MELSLVLMLKIVKRLISFNPGFRNAEFKLQELDLVLLVSALLLLLVLQTLHTFAILSATITPTINTMILAILSECLLHLFKHLYK